MRLMNGLEEISSRERRGENTLAFGISYLDDATKGIFPSDLILIGARSGAGKTQLCCEILNSVVATGKRVLYVALEAEFFEIESRLKFKLFMDAMVESNQRFSIQFDNWMLGRYVHQYPEQENKAQEVFQTKYKNAFVRYKSDSFTVKDLIETVISSADEVDLIIVDHVHYFDFDDDQNENRAIKQIAKTARTLALEEAKPIILVSHLRKSDKKIKELAPDMDEFHGSSELFKIATKVITLGPGRTIHNGSYETFIRVAKNRFNGGCGSFVGRIFFSPKGGGYAKTYDIGWADAAEFEDLGADSYPAWAKRPSSSGGNSYPAFARQSKVDGSLRGSQPVQDG